MAGTIKVSLGGYTIVFFVTLLFLVLIVVGILIYRQIQRLRKNNARKEINLTVASDVNESYRQNIQAKIQAVGLFKKIHCPKFTDCTMIAHHANKPYVHRMIACDEILRDIDRQLEFINADLARLPGQSTYAYLCDIKDFALSELQPKFIERLSFLHDAARYRTQFDFGEEELTELRNLLSEFVRILNRNQERLCAIRITPVKSGLLDNRESRLSIGKTRFWNRHYIQEDVPLLNSQNSSPELNNRKTSKKQYNEKSTTN